ncbi:UDP-glucose 4-epimerase GalE [Silvanigrella aquatica]|uniref:UDP-glucose 4-epimerase n=1 Tax=Silvanigrella aquatica TaxID=1915309 RepID=A0A1L4D3U1_9BACT|nr:UDP-glucose 4-epimerase GalE [Silvanigrella aquatica]APJ04873.1 UDP-glucose 4-epimerase GalE [Silvanigrella aquatica]
MKVLVTGGAGYIGSTVCSALEDVGYTPIILDSLVTGKKEFVQGKRFYQADIADKVVLKEIFKEHPEIQHAIHCAALIIVPESVEKPYEYYKENVAKSNELFKNLLELGCKNIVFSSSAAIYDKTDDFIVTEKSSLKPNSPYSKTKLMMEMILEDYCHAYSGMKAISLRYFNPIGADPKMRSGSHAQNATHVVAKLVETALGKNSEFCITGVNWPTRDGSGIRDYIHVWDLAQAHVKAIENFNHVFEQQSSSYSVLNIGTGTGVTVKELLAAFESVYGKILPKKESDPRPGDVAGAYANADSALKLINWKANLTIENAIYDALKWAEIQKNLFK